MYVRHSFCLLIAGRSIEDLASASSSTSPPTAGIPQPPTCHLPGALQSPAAHHSLDNAEQRFNSSGSASAAAIQPPVDSPSPRTSNAVGQQGWDSGSWSSSEDSVGAAERNSEGAERDSESNDVSGVTGLPVQRSDTADNPLFDGAAMVRLRSAHRG